MTIPSQFIKDRYGSKRGLLNLLQHQFLLLTGKYDHLLGIDLTSITRLVFICEGNICRSPLAEVVARGLNIEACSFGLGCTDDHPADPRATAFASKLGLDLSNHRTQNIQGYLSKPGDLLIGMEPKHISRLAPWVKNGVQCTLLGLFLDTPLSYIHDPFNTTPTYFCRCEEQVKRATVKLLKRASLTS
ncbi:MAG TPA: hypothetical protein VIZ65_04555 [Cellvibrionaceae bacterium]